ncbi:HAD-IA family hydrolase [Aureimonas sp. OT7]|uniref:HAD-IA family hydrolase n=1 Tax=Aureimonas sp. OT7 TaxID=2816454 RepID=UPI00177C8CFB|nr:HAD-IA family hydrolase [Aureimonas sp. OT7]QOG05825.1 HAD-IA family hydrolase [Aureimonas sp. OT7]
MRLFLFDCDGTIADSFAVICSTMRGAFRARGLVAPADTAIHGIIGLSLAEAMQRLRPGSTLAEAEDLADAYRVTFQAARAAGQVHEPLFPGMKDLVAGLSAVDENLVGMVTGKSRRGVDFILATHGLADRFHVVRTADDCPSKPHPAMVLESCTETGIAPSDTVVIGDAAFDMAMARAAGATGIGVAWGAARPDALRAAGATAVATDANHLGQLLDAWRAHEDPVRWIPDRLETA